ncbi:MAG: hypothetical protein QG629_849 [Patescibacteria group bacterium]|nr:hypothetical protein [Candidatus Saccharibacteria bacterium]MDQ5963766.1 hypothetical protein [Patescibacteria group bacterium]
MSYEPSWTDEYREIVEFYWWEPQIIGRSEKNYRKFRSADEMWHSVAPKEVALNHILNIFFALFPLEKLTIFDLTEQHQMLSSKELADIQTAMGNATQPDFFFVSEKEHVAIELKTATKSSRQQLEKYRKLHDFIDTQKPFRIILLTPHTQIQDIVREPIDDYPHPIEVVSINAFHQELGGLHDLGSTEQRLVRGIRQYLARYFSGILTTY